MTIATSAAPHPACENAAEPAPGAEDYLAFARGGDAQALERALGACVDRVFTQARRMMGDGEDAEDAAQEALLLLVRTAARYDGRVPFPSWIGRVVHTACLRTWRSQRRRQRRETMAMMRERSARSPVSEDEVAPQVRAAVALLSPADRLAIDLHYFAGLSQLDAAKAIGVSENAMALRLSRARARLRRLLTMQGTRITLPALVTMLGTQPLYAASDGLRDSISTLAAAVSSGAGLPCSTMAYALVDRAILIVSAHLVLASTALAAVLAVGIALPVLFWTGEVPPAPVSGDIHGVVQAWPPPAPEKGR